MTTIITAVIETEHTDLSLLKRPFSDGMYRPSRIESRWLVEGSTLVFRGAKVWGPNIKKDGTDAQNGSSDRVHLPPFAQRGSDAECFGELGEEIREVLLGHQQQALNDLARLSGISARK